uniref:Neurotransmitter-gated ion-channel ligand-binding domain-containing protein n=1 Tax=Plectus sambesii TaxID=2011161 RepID=A0A914XNA5_9BILA
MASLAEYRQVSLFWFTFVILVASSVFANRFDVYKAITADYDKNVFRDQNFSGPVVVSIELTSFQLLHMDQIQETITFMTTIGMIWKDENLSWNASEFGGTSSVVIPYSLLWKPDITLTSGLSIDYITPDEQRYVNVQDDGTIQSTSYCLITNQCRMSVEDFPYDIQTCTITLEPWIYPTDQVDLVVGKKRWNLNTTIDDGYFKGNGEWTVVSFDKKLYYNTASNGQRYAAVDHTIKFRRQPIYYICVLVIPTFVTATICLFGLFVPAMNNGERVEKVNMGLATLLFMAVILGIVASEMPKTTTLPLLGFFVLVELILCTIGVIVSMLIMLAHQRASTRALIPPACLNTILLLKMKAIQKLEKTDGTTVDTKNVIRHGPVVVSVEMLYFNLLFMDQRQETITFTTTMEMIWKDENLSWNANEFGGTSSILIPSELLWKPDIIVPTGLSIDNITPDEQRYVSVLSDGTVRSISYCLITNECRLSIEAFPFDIQTCNITLESWMHPTDKIALVVGRKLRNLNATINDGDFWVLKEI